MRRTVAIVLLAALQEATEAFSEPEVQEASENISTYFQEECDIQG